MAFDRKVVVILAVAGVIVLASFIYFVVIVGNPGGTNFTGYTQISGGTCIVEEWTANYTGSVNELLVTLYGTGPGSVVPTSLQMAIYNSAGSLLTSGSPPSSENIGFVTGGYTGYYVDTTNAPTITQGEQYWILSVASATGGYETQSSSSQGYELSCGGSVPALISTPPSSTSLGAEAVMYAQGTTSSSTSSSTTTPLSVSISSSPSSGIAPLSTSFTSTVSGGIAPYTYSWTFGDSSTSSQANPSHTYQSAGTYLAQLKVTDSTGAAASSSFTVVANSVSSSTTTYTTTTVTTTLTSTGVTTITSGSSTFTSTYTSVMTSQECLILSSVPQCHLPNTPPGLPIAWATSNMSVGAQEITGQIQIAAGLSVGNIQATNTISNIAFSPSYEALQVEFSSSGPVTLSLQVPHQPSAVWADAQQITTWNYSNGILTVNADPSAITVFFGSASNSSSVTAFLEANWILIVVIVAIGAAIVGATARKR